MLLASSDLRAWEPILTNPPAIGAVEFGDAGGGNPTVRFYRAVEGTAAGTPRVEIAPLYSSTGGGPFLLRVTGLVSEGPVVIYASSNLVDWQTVFTNPPTIGPLQFLEDLATVPAQRFYRACEIR